MEVAGLLRRRGLLAMTGLLLLFFISSAYAASPIGVVTGPKTGTYFAFGRDIAEVSKQVNVPLAIKASEGSIDNIKRINSTENAALGIVQSDVLGFLTRSKNPDSARAAHHLRVVFPLYNEEVHVLARRDIKSFAELDGKKLAIGEENSGNMLTAVNLFSLMNITPAVSKKISAEQGVVAVLRGELDAVVFVGGKPVRLFKNLEDLASPENPQYAKLLDNVHFLPLTDAKILAEYKPAELSKLDYEFVEENVPTVAVQALLVSYDFKQVRGAGRCEMLGTLAKSMRAALPSLKEKGHPKWKEVNLDADIGVWKKDACAWK
ncbi:MAG: TAXI family TRAP transporter solute-binding subunit [Alphaproteobacteria bacterium]|nr:TAXI family TRAP transporter solute-binding subunit [Alphaproteobacteria bacterium]